ncbi:hypothetical protein V6N13_124390 [Hibiscus sabdariffa]
MLRALRKIKLSGNTDRIRTSRVKLGRHNLPSVVGVREQRPTSLCLLRLSYSSFAFVSVSCTCISDQEVINSEPPWK